MGKSDLSVSKEKKQQIQSAEHRHMGWYYFEFKTRLIGLGISFPKLKFLYLNSQPNDPQES